MSGALFMKFLMVSVLSGVLGWCVFSRYDEEIGTENGNTRRQRYLPYLNTAILPELPLILFCAVAFTYGIEEAFRTIIPMCFSIFLHICIYYAFLAPVLPYLRRKISARACALLWLLPNYTYLVYCNRIMASTKPRIILHIPETVSTVLFSIWLIGFLVVLLRSIIQHLTFRKQLLAESVTVNDPQILEVWKTELENARIRKPKYKLMVSEQISTPLSIGFFRKSICVVLPKRSYTKEELRLILRHEIIHICRGDSSNKFSMVFCCAMCWFNPLMWMAMRKSADDLELSCDETVLLNADEKTKKQYASLILNTVSDERGFTTCLSASPAALRYRLRNIIHNEEKASGFLITAAICFLLFFSFGNIALSCGEFTGRELIFAQNGTADLSDCELSGMSVSFDYGNGLIYCNDESALKQYFADMKLSRINGNYSLDRFHNEVQLFFVSPESEFYIHLRDQIMEVRRFGVNQNGLVYYHVGSEIDWEYLSTLFGPRVIQDPTLGFPPEMQVMPDATSTYYTAGNIKTLTVDGKLKNENVHFSPYAVVAVCEPYTNIVNFTFTHEPSFPFHIEITDHTGKQIDVITYETQATSYPLPFFDDYSYRCFVTFEDEISILEMEYTFNMHYFPE